MAGWADLPSVEILGAPATDVLIGSRSILLRPVPSRFGPRKGVRFLRAKAGRPGDGGPRPAQGFEADSGSSSLVLGRFIRGGLRRPAADCAKDVAKGLGLEGRTLTIELAAAMFGLERRRPCDLPTPLVVTGKPLGLPIDVPVRSDEADEALECVGLEGWRGVCS